MVSGRTIQEVGGSCIHCLCWDDDLCTLM